MIKKLTTVFLVAFSIGANAGVLDELKKTPASKYDIGKMQLELGAFLLTQKLKDKNVGKSPFEIQGFRVTEDENKLYFVTTLEGRAKHMNDQACEKLKTHMSESGPLSQLAKQTWPGLTDAQYQSLESDFVLATELVSKENNSFRIQC